MAANNSNSKKIKTSVHLIGKRREADGGQDRALVWSRGPVTVTGIFDGHGTSTTRNVREEGGRISSRLCRDFIEAKLEEEGNPDWRPEQWTTYLTELFPRAHKNLHEQFKTIYKGCNPGKLSTPENPYLVDPDTEDTISGGTTATLVVSYTKGTDRFVVCANVGDSEAFLMSSKGIRELTHDHTPSSLTECMRVRQSDLPVKGRCIYSVNDTEIFTASGNERPVPASAMPDTVTGMTKMTLNPEGTKWVWNGRETAKDTGTYFVADYSDIYVRLAMTRSLGDFPVHAVGAISVPECTVVLLDPTETGVEVLCSSDGIWDLVVTDEFFGQVHHLKSIKPLTAEAIFTDLVIPNMVKYARGQQGDDISLVVTSIPDVAPKASNSSRSSNNSKSNA